MRVFLLTIAAMGAIGMTVAAPAASGDGGPGPGVRQGWDGVAAKGVRYVTLTTAGWTTLTKIQRDGGRVVNYLNIKGAWGIPAVAFDGTTAGLTHDGNTLILSQVRASPALRTHSSFTLVDTKALRKARTLHIAGDHSFDALSPDGRYLYLVEYVSAQDLSRYRVRAYDLRARKLLPKPVVDKRESEVAMQGSPMSRVTSPGGTWVYTLYGGGKHPFIHALDTRHVEAVCVDLPKSWNRIDVAGLRLRWTPQGRIAVRYQSGGRALATVDVKKLRVMSIVRVP
jgi:hypothetical protein